MNKNPVLSPSYYLDLGNRKRFEKFVYILKIM